MGLYKAQKILGVEPKIGVVFNPPKWMVYFMENPIKMDDLGVPLHYTGCLIGILIMV